MLDNKTLSAYLDYINQHKMLVAQYIDKFLDMEIPLDVDKDSLIYEKEFHDSDKLQPGRLELFAIRYAITNNQVSPTDIPTHIFALIKKVLLDHVIRNDHHLEYYAIAPVNNHFRFDKTKADIAPIKPIPVEPDDTGIVKVCCDWCAVSTTLNSSPIVYAKHVFGKRFRLEFATQRKFFLILRRLWKDKYTRE